ncbi:GNAT family N-acetyltransferase [Clostridium sp.]|uniref:GNAT family N-acetyltransferase n=1 Tax=Clostridium sp. TaxID=1506 RepID=UPI0025B92A55|nr:GNAT family N-acetyltransferase [Clostridium sp.]
MLIRRYETSDCKELAELFYNTVHSINAKDYTEEQLNVWATGNIDLEKWNKSLLSHFSVVAVEDGIIVGFGDIDETGYLDRLYVHKEYQYQGIASAICAKLEYIFDVEKITTHASITAKPFFEKRGYKVIKKQNVERNGLLLENYVMEKEQISFGHCI